MKSLMRLIEKKALFLPAAGVLCLALAATTAFARVSARPAMTPQANADAAVDAAKFLGTWRWMVKGQSVVTMTLSSAGSGITGSMTAIEGIQLDKNNNVESIQPGKGRIPILNARIENSVLHFETKDIDNSVQWTMTLKPDGTAEVEPSAPGSRIVKPIAAEKVH